MVPDYHIHSVFSPEIECKDRIEEIFEKCLSLGLTSFGISDHLHCEMNVPFLIKARMVYEKIKGDFPFYFGVEVSVLREYDIEENRKSENPSLYGYKEGGPYESPLIIYLPENLKKILKFDYVIGGVHWPLGAPFLQKEIILSYHRQYMFLANHPDIDIIAHLWWWHGHWQDKNGNYPDLPWLGDFSVIPDEIHYEFAEAVVKNKKAVEINAGAIFFNPKYPEKFKRDYINYLKKLKERGVIFATGSDAHSIDKIENVIKLIDILNEIGIKPEELWRPENGRNKDLCFK